jgi:hypothetical protein
VVTDVEVTFACAIVPNVEGQRTELVVVVQLMSTAQNAETDEFEEEEKVRLSLPQSLPNFVVGSTVANGLADQLGLQSIDDVHPIDILPIFDRG